jgi:hypothetical protein
MLRAALGELRMRMRSSRILLLLRLLILVTRIRGLPLTKVDCRRQRYPLHWLRGKGFVRIDQGVCGSCRRPVEAARSNAIVAVGAGHSPAIGVVGVDVVVVILLV